MHFFESETATDSSTTLQNKTEIDSVLVEEYASKEAAPLALILYTDVGPKHQTTFLNVKIALIFLQKYLDLDQVIGECTALGHYYQNPAEKINCLLIDSLCGMACMCQ